MPAPRGRGRRRLEPRRALSEPAQASIQASSRAALPRLRTACALPASLSASAAWPCCSRAASAPGPVRRSSARRAAASPRWAQTAAATHQRRRRDRPTALPIPCREGLGRRGVGCRRRAGDRDRFAPCRTSSTTAQATPLPGRARLVVDRGEASKSARARARASARHQHTRPPREAERQRCPACPYWDRSRAAPGCRRRAPGAELGSGAPQGVIDGIESASRAASGVATNATARNASAAWRRI